MDFNQWIVDMASVGDLSILSSPGWPIGAETHWGGDKWLVQLHQLPAKLPILHRRCSSSTEGAAWPSIASCPGSGSSFDASLFNWLSGGGGASGAGGACGNGGTVRHGERNRGSNNRAPLEFSCEFSQRTQSRSFSSFESGLGTKQGWP